MGQSSITGPFSMAMLNNQRVASVHFTGFPKTQRWSPAFHPLLLPRRTGGFLAVVFLARWLANGSEKTGNR